MSAVDLLQPILEGGLERNNFFNGRLLSAEDLRTEQAATREQSSRIARTIGDGIAWGLGVSVASVGPERPRVLVRSGLAINRLGNLLRLPESAEVALVPGQKAAIEGAGLFVECETPSGPAPSGEGAYVLAIAPTSGFRGTALISDPNATSAGRGACGARLSVEGIAFRLVPIVLTQLAGIDPALRARVLALLPRTDAPSRERLRNVLAHLAFGSQALVSWFKDPLGTSAGAPWPGWGLLDAMRGRGDLTDCDVPLAIVVLTGGVIRFVDLWSVRRRPVDAAAVDAWRNVAGPRRIAEGEAAFLQFQSQLETLNAAGSPSSLSAAAYLDLLPAGGWLPTGSSGFNWKTFLGICAPPSVTPVDAALLRGILERSWFDEPFAPDFTPPVPVRVYEVPGEPYVVFARSHLGNIRVILNPAPAANEGIEVTATAATGRTTKAAARSGRTVPIPELIPGPHTVRISASNFEAVAPLTATVVGGRTVDVDVALKPLPNGRIVVTPIDRRGNPVKPTSVSATGGGKTVAGIPQSSGKWLIPDLPVATYEVHGIASGYTLATASGIGPTVRGQDTPATLVFDEQERRPQPPRCVDVKVLEELRIRAARVCMVLTATEIDERYFYKDRVAETNPAASSGLFALANRAEPKSAKSKTKRRKSGDVKQQARYTTATGEIVFRDEPWRDMKPLKGLPPEMQKWLIDWRDWFAEVLDDTRIQEATPIVYVDPKYLPATQAKQVRRLPPAYAVFRLFGVPLLIKPAEGLTKSPVQIDKAQLPGIPDETVFRLFDAGIRYIDDLAWGWEELIEDATAEPPDVIRYLVEDALHAVQAINDERRYYAGVDKSVDRILKDNNILDDVALANADPEKLGEKLGSRGFAMRLIHQAREIAPEDAWALDTLPLTAVQIEAFEHAGIESQGMLAASAARNDGKALIAEVIGVETEGAAVRDAAVSALANEAVMLMASGSLASTVEKSLVMWEQVDAVTASKLGRAGFVSVEDLAAAEPDAVAAAAGLEAEAARKLVADAKASSRAGMTVGMLAPVSKAEEKNLKDMLGEQPTVGAILNKTPAELAGAFGGNAARANAVLSGIRAGLAARRIG